MGCAQSELTEDQKKAILESSKLDKVLTATNNEEGKIVKLLLLGTGESGKSTIFKQMQILYQEGFSDLEKGTYRQVIRRNVVEAMQTLINGCSKFNIEFQDGGSAAAAEFIQKLDPLVAEFWQQEIIEHIQHLWNNEEAIKQMYLDRSKLQLLDSAEYLFKNVKRIGKGDFTPSPEDILRARLRTSGIVERMFKIQGSDFKFLDVGGQRNERRKWIHCFDNVTALIFVAAISEYDQVLYEDEKKNRLVEAVEVFENIVNGKYFKHSVFVLFLNKTDIFQEKIKRIPLQPFFSDYKGDDDDADAAAKFIEGLFEATNKSKKTIFVHQTCATDTRNVERVFEAAKKAILEGSVRELGDDVQ